MVPGVEPPPPPPRLNILLTLSIIAGPPILPTIFPTFDIPPLPDFPVPVPGL
jgi:hypothetical protein